LFRSCALSTADSTCPLALAAVSFARSVAREPSSRVRPSASVPPCSEPFSVPPAVAPRFPALPVSEPPSPPCAPPPSSWALAVPLVARIAATAALVRTLRMFMTCSRVAADHPRSSPASTNGPAFLFPVAGVQICPDQAFAIRRVGAVVTNIQGGGGQGIYRHARAGGIRRLQRAREQARDDRSREGRAADLLVFSTDGRGFQIRAGRREIHLLAAAGLGQHFVLLVDAGYSDDVRIGGRIERRRGRTVVADGGNEQETAHRH